MALITYAQAVSHLKQNGVLDAGSPPEEDADLVLKIEQASATVLLHLQRQGEWDVNSNPEDDPEFAIVQALVLKVLSWLYRYRGDDDTTPTLETILNLTTMGALKDRVIA
jgi:hypothetical protein